MNWDEIDQAAGGDQQFKDYAPNGEYKVKLAKVEIRDNPNWKSPALSFIWKETDEYKFPKSCTHWLSIAKPNWRMCHNRDILMLFGVDKAKAQQLIEAAEKDQDREKLKRAYEDLYKRIAERGAEVEITVHDQYNSDGNKVVATGKNGTKYTPSETDFKSHCRMANKPKQNTVADSMGESADINLDSIPF